MSIFLMVIIVTVTSTPMSAHLMEGTAASKNPIATTVAVAFVMQPDCPIAHKPLF